MPQTYTRLLYHVVFSTKSRESWLEPAWRPELYELIGGVVRNRKGEMLAIGGVSDHVHLLLRLPATRSLSDVVRDVKANSSGWLHDRGVFAFDWQDGYGAFTLGPSAIRGVSTYIENQEAHHARASFADEMRAMLLASAATEDELRDWG
ncbi:IS200/IS605 family transposase [Gemmata sp. JC717]|uniref:IS200/IS605 family transposase n=1 Tax=Gemmata algarum TaxID=2975278 RepID=UPI0021BA88D0|nr:IS200/IS605 family transposase [Gemmata algarum]MDY3555043.1 IS200/IS605 family transposase [Gemmata algarum]